MRFREAFLRHLLPTNSTLIRFPCQFLTPAGRRRAPTRPMRGCSQVGTSLFPVQLGRRWCGSGCTKKAAQSRDSSWDFPTTPCAMGGKGLSGGARGPPAFVLHVNGIKDLSLTPRGEEIKAAAGWLPEELCSQSSIPSSPRDAEAAARGTGVLEIIWKTSRKQVRGIGGRGSRTPPFFFRITTDDLKNLTRLLAKCLNTRLVYLYKYIYSLYLYIHIHTH